MESLTGDELSEQKVDGAYSSPEVYEAIKCFWKGTERRCSDKQNTRTARFRFIERRSLSFVVRV